MMERTRERNVGVLLAAVLVVVGTSGTAATADTELWDDSEVLDSDEVTTDVEEIPQEASVIFDGPSALETEEFGNYSVEVTNSSDGRALDEWALGLSVDDITTVDELTVRRQGEESDITDGESGFDVELDDEADILYLRDDDTADIEPGGSETLEFEVAFHTEGEFTGTAYVIEDEAATGAITGQVTDSGGDGIEGANVEADGPTDTSTTTDGDGNYELAGLEDGEYDLAFDADGYTGTTLPGAATVEDGGTVTGVDVTLFDD